jgi:hypothetical protein
MGGQASGASIEIARAQFHRMRLNPTIYNEELRK